MITKHITEEKDGCFTSYEQYIHEPITAAIGDSISDFYNMMHLIKNAWTNEEYELKMRDAGYDIYNKDKKHEAWIGILEKRDRYDWPWKDNIGNYLVFLVYCEGNMAQKMWERFDADGSGIYVSILYSQLSLDDILKEKTEEDQRKIVKNWLSKIVEKIFSSSVI
jgi:hypothetical protein